MRRYLKFAAVAAALAIAACSDGTSNLPGVTDAGTHFAASRNAPVDQLILKLYPRGIETATGQRWDRIDLELGTWDASTRQWQGTSVLTAQKHLVDLIKFIQLKTGDIEASGLAAGETRPQAAARLIAAMSGYVFGGPDATPPPAGADIVVATVPAGAQTTIVTPEEQAGLFLPAGATSEERVIVIAENVVTGPRCSGPLAYSHCQYPQFYHFESLPALKLNSPGHFAVCMDVGTLGPSDEEHSRISLAHDLPPSPVLYTPGATQVEGVEILPLVGEGDQTGMLDCDHPPVIGLRTTGERIMYAVNKFISKHLSPKKAYAYDSGPEHFSDFFSNFNGVDPTISGVWNGVLRPPGAETGGQPVTMILRRNADGCVGEFRVAAVGSTVAYNVTRALTSCSVDTGDGLFVSAAIDPWSAPTSNAQRSDFNMTLYYNTLNGTAARTFPDGEGGTFTEDPWTLLLTRSTTGVPAITVAPALKSSIMGSDGSTTTKLY